MNNKNFKSNSNSHKQPTHRINNNIRVPQVRLVGENIEAGVYNTQDAIKIAKELLLDLIEISPNANPPVCKISDYNKFLYELKVREREQAKKQRETNKELKEIRFTSNTDEGDIETKKKKIIEFLKKGHKVKTFIIFKGREITHSERGQILLLKLATDVEEVGKAEYLPKMEGKNMHMIIAPKK
jgi:translation initiation factor IF-3